MLFYNFYNFACLFFVWMISVWLQLGGAPLLYIVSSQSRLCSALIGQNTQYRPVIGLGICSGDNSQSAAQLCSAQVSRLQSLDHLTLKIDIYTL